MESNWRYNFYRYGLCNIWERGPGFRPLRCGVLADVPLHGWLDIISHRGEQTHLLVPPVVITDLKIHILEVAPFSTTWAATVDTNHYKDVPLVMPWQVRTDPH